MVAVCCSVSNTVCGCLVAVPVGVDVVAVLVFAALLSAVELVWHFSVRLAVLWRWVFVSCSHVVLCWLVICLVVVLVDLVFLVFKAVIVWVVGIVRFVRAVCLV